MPNMVCTYWTGKIWKQCIFNCIVLNPNWQAVWRAFIHSSEQTKLLCSLTHKLYSPHSVTLWCTSLEMSAPHSITQCWYALCLLSRPDWTLYLWVFPLWDLVTRPVSETQRCYFLLLTISTRKPDFTGTKGPHSNCSYFNLHLNCGNH